MSGKEIKVYVSERDDIYYNIIIVDENKKQLSKIEIGERL